MERPTLRLKKNNYSRHQIYSNLNKTKLNEYIDNLLKEVNHFKNYSSHTDFCSWQMNGNCDCGYKRD